MAPVRMIYHLSTKVQDRASASWGRVRAVLRASPAARFPIPLVLPCEILLGVIEMLPPESAVSLVCTCWYMRGLYCEEGTFVADQFWDQLLRRTFPMRLTGAPGPNAPPRLRRSNQITLCALSSDWVHYVRELRQAPHLTGVQIAKFVRWAASAHSWYKHLPLQNAAVFSFVLDVTVGMKRTPDGFVEQHEVRAASRTPLRAQGATRWRPVTRRGAHTSGRTPVVHRRTSPRTPRASKTLTSACGIAMTALV